MNPFGLPFRPRLDRLRPLFQAAFSEQVTLAGLRLHVPGPLPIRLGVVLGNLRMQHIFDRLLRPGNIVVDVGANTGYNTFYAAHCVGHTGRVYAVEPAQDNLAVLYEDLFANRFSHVHVLPYAAGSRKAVRPFYLRGSVSAVNSLFQESFYADVTETVDVFTARLDDLIHEKPDLVKIDVEGAELDVLQGMSRMLEQASTQLVVEWHPTLQMAAGHPPDALPRYLLDRGFILQIVTHTSRRPLHPATLPAITQALLAARRPVELLHIPNCA
ncbi:FkbM family methyltransferase [bacterium]|nr:FkbM family methyltransferase [bacterium]